MIVTPRSGPNRVIHLKLEMGYISNNVNEVRLPIFQRELDVF